MKKTIFFNLGLLFFAFFISLSFCLAIECQGCSYNDSCYNFGDEIKIVDIGKYCDSLTREFVNQTAESGQCENDFECSGSLRCIESHCEDLYKRIIGMNQSLYNISGYYNIDYDLDSIVNERDNCKYVYNPNQTDSDNNCPVKPFTNDPKCGDACDPSEPVVNPPGWPGGPGGGIWIRTYTLNDATFRKGYNNVFCEDDEVIFPLEGKSYKMTVLEIGDLYAMLRVPFKSTYKDSSVTKGLIARFNVLDKGFYDLQVLLNSATRSGCANISLKYLHEAITENTGQVIDDDDGLDDALSGDNADVSKRLRVWVWWIIFLIIIMAIFVVCYLLYKNLRQSRQEKKADSETLKKIAWKPNKV